MPLRDKHGRWAKQGKKIEKMIIHYGFSGDSYILGPSEVVLKINEIIDVLNSLTDWKKKVEGYIWTGEYEGDATAEWKPKEKEEEELKAILYDKKKEEWRGVFGTMHDPNNPFPLLKQEKKEPKEWSKAINKGFYRPEPKLEECGEETHDELRKWKPAYRFCPYCKLDL